MTRMISVVLLLTFLFNCSEVWGESSSPAKTWRLVSELTETERVLFDPHTDTPRDSRFPYLPAERYPFEPPYTA